MAPDLQVGEIAKLLVEKNIGAVPVVDASGTLAGIVTESDLMRRRELGTERQPQPDCCLRCLAIAPDLTGRLVRAQSLIGDSAQETRELRRQGTQGALDPV